MARKQFVSSMKNAPSRAVSSKEAALQGRRGDLSDDDDLASDGDDETASMNGDEPGFDGNDGAGGESPVSSAPSSPISSDDDDDGDDENDKDHANDGMRDDDDDPAEQDDGDGEDPAAAVAVQVMPASVGRGKQLRFPTAISRGKEARILHNGSDRDGSDSESYASVASDEEEDNDDEMQPAGATPSVTGAVASPLKSPTLAMGAPAAAGEEGEEDEGEEEDDTVYPIKAFRARKRHRPDSGYFTQMSTHVRDCLLSIRDVSTAEALSEEAHHEFRRKLSAGTVERVPWKQVSPPPPAPAPSDSEKKVPKGSPERESSDKKRAREEKDSRTSKSSSSRKSSGADERSDRRAEKSSRSTGDNDAADRKKERSGKENDSRSSTSKRENKDSSRSSSDKKDTRESSDKTKSSSKSSSSSSSSSKRVEENGHGASSKSNNTTCEDLLCAKCKKSVSEQNADEAQRKASVEAAAKAAALQAAAAQATLDAAKATAAAAAREPPPVATSTPVPVPMGPFILPTNATRDIAQMRDEAGRLNDEARSLKHEGNRRGVADPGPEGQAAQGRYYLRSSAKFFEHALLLADMKAAYREANDERSARQYGNYCMQTLAQTSSLIESTVRRMRTAGNRRLVALGLKLTSLVELTIYRLQHVKLFSIYSNLNTTGRSPDSRQNGTTPPLNGSGSDGQDSALKALLHKEMEHTLRGFEMWHQYETCRVEVLPRITNPAVVDLNVLFEDLAAELGQS